jgi:hypothetical protein
MMVLIVFEVTESLGLIKAGIKGFGDINSNVE